MSDESYQERLFGKGSRDFLDPARLQARRDAGVETQAVKKLMEFCGVPVVRAKGDAKDAFGAPDLTFAWLHHRFPAFPVQMMAAKLPYMHEVPMSALFGKNFLKLPFMIEYRKQLAALGVDPVETNAGMVFNCPRAVGASFMVVHNRPQLGLADRLRDRTTRVLHACGSPSVTYVVEGLRDFAEAIGKEWSDTL